MTVLDRERFEREIVPKGEPAVLRGLVAEWPIVEAAAQGDEALAGFLREAASDEPFEAWFGAPEIEGRFGYTRGFSGFNHERRLATIDQLLDLLLRQRGSDQPYSMYAGGIPIRRHLAGPASDDTGAAARHEQSDVDLAVARQPHAHRGALGPAAEPRLRRRRAAALHACSRPTRSPTFTSARSTSRWPASRSAWSMSTRRTSTNIRGSPKALEAAQTAELGPRRRALHPEPVVARSRFARRAWRDDQFLVARRRTAAADAAERALPFGDHDEESAARTSSRRGACCSAITSLATTATPLSICPSGRVESSARRTPELVARVKKLLIDALSR